VAAHHDAVGAQPDVELDRRDAELERAGEPGERVLRGVPARSSVPDDGEPGEAAQFVSIVP
jgi:hypothetical protein